MAVIGSLPVMVISSTGTEVSSPGSPLGGHVVGEVGLVLVVGGGELGDGVPWGQAEAAGAAVGGVAPGAGQAGDDGGVAAADDQREPGGQLADHVRGRDVVPGGVVLAAELPRRLPAQRARGLQRGWCR